MTDNIDMKFWKEWEESGDLGRIAKMKVLVRVGLIRDVHLKSDIDVYVLANKLNMYFEDLKHYLEEEKQK